ncbi:MAG: YciI family protein [Thermomicrobiales bacterium]
MRYLLLIYAEESRYGDFTGEELQDYSDRHNQLGKDAADAGVLLDAQRLQPVQTARSIALRGDKLILSDGPFAETKEQLGGFYYIDVETPEEALEWAKRIPQNGSTTIEIRPVLEM